jgi:hypothetical protein
MAVEYSELLRAAGMLANGGMRGSASTFTDSSGRSVRGWRLNPLSGLSDFIITVDAQIYRYTTQRVEKDGPRRFGEPQYEIKGRLESASVTDLGATYDDVLDFLESCQTYENSF